MYEVPSLIAAFASAGYLVSYFISFSLCFRSRNFLSFLAELPGSKRIELEIAAWLASIPLVLIAGLQRRKISDFTSIIRFLTRAYSILNSASAYFQLTLLFRLATETLEAANREFKRAFKPSAIVPNRYFKAYDGVMDFLQRASAFYVPFLTFDMPRVTTQLIVMAYQLSMTFNGHPSMWAVASKVLEFVWNSATVIWLVESAETFNFEVEIFEKNLRDCTFFNSKKITNDKLLFYVRYSGKFKLSVNNFFHVDRSFLIKMFGGVITAVVCLVQIGGQSTV